MSLDRFRVAVNQAESDPEEGRKKGEIKKCLTFCPPNEFGLRERTHIYKDCPKNIQCNYKDMCVTESSCFTHSSSSLTTFSASSRPQSEG